MASVMEMLLRDEGLEDATDVLFIGDSTGGIATAHVVDDVHAQVGMPFCPAFLLVLRPDRCNSLRSDRHAQSSVSEGSAVASGVVSVLYFSGSA